MKAPARVARLWVRFGLPIIFLLIGPTAGATTPGKAYRDVHRDALAFLRAADADAWLVDDGRGVLLAEAVRADPLVVGPRSTTLLAALELSSIDARARRVSTLSQFALHTPEDVAVLADLLSQERPSVIALNPAVRPSERTEVGREDRRVPIDLDNALAIRGLHDAGITASDPAYGNAVQDAMLYLLEFQLPDGSWPLVRDGEAGSDPVGSVLVTAEVVRALLPYRNFTITYEVADAQALGINLDVELAIEAAASYLKSASPASAIDRSVRLLAFLEGALDPSDAKLVSAHAELITLGQNTGGTFGDSLFGAALAAQAISRAAELPALAFDTDGNGTADGPDEDSDGDGYCDPGESGDCSGVDAFPLDGIEHTDSDLDGIGDNSDADDDGDGYCDPGQSAPDCIGVDAFQFNATEHADLSGDGIGDVADTDDDHDGLSDIDEALAGLDPNDPDTDGDSFPDAVELAYGTDGADASAYPPPDGDVFPVGAPDGIVDGRDAFIALRIAAGLEVVAPADEAVFLRRGDVAPLTGGAPTPDGDFNSGDVVVILRVVNGGASW